MWEGISARGAQTMQGTIWQNVRRHENLRHSFGLASYFSLKLFSFWGIWDFLRIQRGIHYSNVAVKSKYNVFSCVAKVSTVQYQ